MLDLDLSILFLLGGCARCALTSNTKPTWWNTFRRLSPQLGPRRLAHTMDQPHPCQQADQVVARIDLPPAETLVGTALIIVVVVVPALAQCDQGHEEVVAAGIGGRIAPTPPQVTDRVHCEGRVVRQD